MEALNNLERATKHLANIKKLDAEIIELEKLAMQVAEKENEVSLSLSIKEYKPKEEETVIDIGEQTIEEAIHQAFAFRLTPFGDKKKKEDDRSMLKEAISPNATLQILGILLYEKQQRRARYIDKLKKLGFS